MICWAVGICGITDLKREKNSVQTSNSLLFEARDNLVGDHLRLREAHLLDAAQFDDLDDLLAVDAAQLIGALAADAEDLDLFALVHQRIRPLARQPHDRRIERAAQAALGGADHQQMNLVGAGAGEQARRRVAAGDAGGDVAEHAVHALGERARGFRRHLRAAQLGRRDHLHGLGDLLRRLGGGDANAHVLEGGHFFSVALLRCLVPASSCATPPGRLRDSRNKPGWTHKHHVNVLA